MIKVIGHRGASENAPENTLSSISEAWSQSADGVEVDVRLTKDLKLVCIHDKNTLRTSGKDALVKNTTLEDLRKMDFGAWRGKEWINEPIPVLEEVIELIPKDKKLFIEVKNGKRAINPLVDVLQVYKEQQKNISIISFNEEVLSGVKELLPDITVNLLVSFEEEVEKQKERLLSKIRRSNIDGLGLQSHMQLTKGFLKALMKENKAIHVWTVDQPEEAKRYQEIGLASVTTNRPGQIRNFLLAS
ncbi:MAG: glycerophosphodiester phosphodiesterase family protein [Pseudomonadota bacterium]|nr:glycerophosphodiester phosphodiesterase family protein [Pseudomonadota bacterium]